MNLNILSSVYYSSIITESVSFIMELCVTGTTGMVAIVIASVLVYCTYKELFIIKLLCSCTYLYKLFDTTKKSVQTTFIQEKFFTGAITTAQFELRVSREGCHTVLRSSK